MLTPLLALACTSPAPEPARDSAGEPLEIIAPELAPEWDPQALVDSAAGLLAWGFPESETLRETYVEMMSHGDESCPGDAYQLNDDVVIGCYADSGYFYSGISTYISDDYEGGAKRIFTAELWIIDDAGRKFTASGDTQYRRHEDGWNTWWTGSWVHDGAEGWLGEGISGEIYASKEGGSFSLGGYLDIGPNTAEIASLQFNQEHCPGEFSAQIWIRDPSGLWFLWEAPCGQCGSLSLDGEVVGDALCLDLMTPSTALIARMEAAP